QKLHAVIEDTLWGRTTPDQEIWQALGAIAEALPGRNLFGAYGFVTGTLLAYSQSCAGNPELATLRAASLLKRSQRPFGWDFMNYDTVLDLSQRKVWHVFLHGLNEYHPENEVLLDAVVQKCGQTLVSMAGSYPTEIALTFNARARAALYLKLIKDSRPRMTDSIFQSIRSDIARSVSTICHSGNMSWVPASFLTRAWMRVLDRDLVGARTDLDQAFEIAQRGSM